QGAEQLDRVARVQRGGLDVAQRAGVAERDDVAGRVLDGERLDLLQGVLALGGSDAEVDRRLLRRLRGLGGGRTAGGGGARHGGTLLRSVLRGGLGVGLGRRLLGGLALLQRRAAPAVVTQLRLLGGRARGALLALRVEQLDGLEGHGG